MSAAPARRLGVVAFVAVVTAAGTLARPAPARAETAGAAGDAIAGGAVSAEAAATEQTDQAAERDRRERDLDAVRERLRASDEARARLAAEIAGIRQDSGRLSAALLDAGRRAHAAEERTRLLGERLDTALSSESALRRSLVARRATLANVLGALERMGRRTPPALLVRPDDILAAIRTSMLLGAVLPELRSETAAVAVDLGELVRLREMVAHERDALAEEHARLASEQERLTALVAVRQSRLTAAETESADERARAETLARQAGSLQELVDRMQTEIATAARAAEQARRLAAEQAQLGREKLAAAALRDPARLAPKMPFAEARGLLPRPASGTVLREFGSTDGLGGTMRGTTFATRPGAAVTSACDGWVVFAGPFRSFGRLLIINGGSGYYVVLAGLDQVSVDVGQFVLAGEPVGQMGRVASSSAALGAIEADGPVLYVEIRKDGGPIDPSPWWAKSQGEKVRG